MKYLFSGIFILTSVFLKPAFAQTGYTLIHKIALKGDGKWDYMQMDEPGNRLFIAHGDRAHVIDLSSYKELGVVGGLSGAHHVTLTPEFKKGFITNGENNTVTVFDYKTLRTIGTIKINHINPDPMCYDSYSKKVYVFCDDSTAVIIDPVSNRVTGAIALGGAPDFAMSDGKGLIYNDLEGGNETVVIDVKLKKAVKRFKLPGHAAPTGLAFDQRNSRLFVSCRGINKLAVLDAGIGKLITLLPMPKNVDGVCFDEANKYIFCSGGEGYATIIKQESANQYKTIEHLITMPGAKTMELNQKNHELYFSAASFSNSSDKIKPGTFEIRLFKKIDS